MVSLLELLLEIWISCYKAEFDNLKLKQEILKLGKDILAKDKMNRLKLKILAPVNCSRQHNISSY